MVIIKDKFKFEFEKLNYEDCVIIILKKEKKQCGKTIEVLKCLM